MLDKMTRFADTAPSKVSEASYPALAGAVSGYLRGVRQTAQVSVQTAAGERPAFSEDELTHLKDVRGLIRLAQRLRTVALVLIGLAILGYVLLRKPLREVFRLVRVDRALVIAAWMVLIPVVAAGLWAAIDFEGFFYSAHRLLFTNELWLLDPETDLLLQLMPLPFFTSYLWDFVKQNVFLLLALPLAAFGLRTARGGASEDKP